MTDPTTKRDQRADQRSQQEQQRDPQRRQEQNQERVPSREAQEGNPSRKPEGDRRQNVDEDDDDRRATDETMHRNK